MDVIRTNACGDTLWTKTYGGSTYDEAKSVQQTSDGGFIIAGSTSSYGAGKRDAYLIRTDANGNVAIKNNLPINHNSLNDFSAIYNARSKYISISYNLQTPGTIELDMYNLKGILVKTIADRYMASGYHSMQVNILGDGKKIRIRSVNPYFQERNSERY